jgi:hypothetical protein
VSHSCDLAWIAHSILHGKGWGCALKIEVHFDESGTDAKELTVAGYLFEATRIDEFCHLWNKQLAEHDLPYFHMVDCAHQAPPFDKMTKDETVRLAMRMMGLIKRFSINGFVCNIQNDKTKKATFYAQAVSQATGMVTEWAEKTSFEGSIAYFFENGDGQGLADDYLKSIPNDPGLKSARRYAGHSFVPKTGNPGVQAADLLAWQYHNFTKKRANSTLARLDLRSLLRHPHLISDNCGALPRESNLQSWEESRYRIETVYYLPSAKENELDGAAIIVTDGDFTLLEGDNTGKILACQNCLRAVAEGFSVSDWHSRFKTQNYFLIQCACKAYCRIPEVMIPLLS